MPSAVFIKQKLPTEIIGIICGFSDFKTHTTIRSTCSSVRLYVPLRKVVRFEAYEKLVTLCNIIIRWSSKDNERRRVFQERIHLDLRHDTLTQNQVEYLKRYCLNYELCRIARKALDHPETCDGIDLLFDDCLFLYSAIRVDDLELLIRLLQIPLMNPAAGRNLAIRIAAFFGRLEIVQFLLQDPRVDPCAVHNEAIRYASKNGHLSVVQELLQDPRVDPTCWRNNAIRWASASGHLDVVQALLLDPRVDPSDDHNDAIRCATRNGHLAIVQELLKDPRVDPSEDHNDAIRCASQNGHQAVVQALLQDPRVDPCDYRNYASCESHGQTSQTRSVAS